MQEKQNTNPNSNLTVVYHDLGTEMDRFDRLPAPVRDALRNAPFQFSSIDVFEDYQQRQMQSFFSEYNATEHARDMEQYFRLCVLEKSYSRAETHGTYRLTKRVHAGSRRRK